MTLHDHIAELRAELRGCILSRSERAQIEAELRAAVATLSETTKSMADEQASALEIALAA